MANAMDEIYRLKVEEIPFEMQEKINEGLYTIYDGVVRDKTNRMAIMKHIPHEIIEIPKNIENANALATSLANKIDVTQNIMMASMAVSTAAILGAIVITTAYLANKIDKLQIKVDAVMKEVHDQNFMHYFEKIIYYFGEVESLREIISETEVIKENADLILLKLNHLSISRNQQMLFINNILPQIESKSTKHQELILNTVNVFLEMLPKATFIESQAAYKIERFYLGDNIRENALLKHEKTILKYKDWCNDMVKLEVHNSKRSPLCELIISEQDRIKGILNSEENMLLLQYAI